MTPDQTPDDLKPADLGEPSLEVPHLAARRRTAASAGGTSCSSASPAPAWRASAWAFGPGRRWSERQAAAGCRRARGQRPSRPQAGRSWSTTARRPVGAPIDVLPGRDLRAAPAPAAPGPPGLADRPAQRDPPPHRVRLARRWPPCRPYEAHADLIAPGAHRPVAAKAAGRLPRGSEGRGRHPRRARPASAGCDFKAAPPPKPRPPRPTIRRGPLRRQKARSREGRAPPNAARTAAPPPGERQAETAQAQASNSHAGRPSGEGGEAPSSSRERRRSAPRKAATDPAGQGRGHGPRRSPGGGPARLAPWPKPQEEARKRLAPGRSWPAPSSTSCRTRPSPEPRSPRRSRWPSSTANTIASPRHEPKIEQASARKSHRHAAQRRWRGATPTARSRRRRSARA